jgi:hypothetical protein
MIRCCRDMLIPIRLAAAISACLGLVSAGARAETTSPKADALTAPAIAPQ